MGDLSLSESKQRIPPDVQVLNDVEFARPSVGHFPLLAEVSEIRHGFTWGPDAQNMSYGLHDGSPEVLTWRNEHFLRNVGMAPLRQTVVIEALIGAPGETTQPTKIDETFLAAHPATPRGIFTPCHMVFTTETNRPIAVKPGDCPVALLAGETGGQPLVGVLHAARRELAMRLPIVVVEHLDGIGCDASTIRAGILPSISPEHHIIRAADVEQHVPNPEVWGDYMKAAPNGDVQLDGSGLLVSQLVEAGVRPDQIELYDVDTYNAAADGVGFSHRFASTNSPQPNGRFMSAIQICGGGITHAASASA